MFNGVGLAANSIGGNILRPIALPNRPYKKQNHDIPRAEWIARRKHPSRQQA